MNDLKERLEYYAAYLQDWTGEMVTPEHGDLPALLLEAAAALSNLAAAPDVDGRDFYELCQEYRHFRGDAVVQFENIKTYIRTGKLPWPSYDEPSATKGIA